MPLRTLLTATILLLGCTQHALGQGQDSTPGERYLRVLAEMLPGIYDNANQNYFDRRRNLPEDERHARLNITIERVEAPAFGPFVFLWISTRGSGEDAVANYRLATLSADGAPEEVTLKHYLSMDGVISVDDLAQLKPEDLRRTEGCDYFLVRRASSFRGAQKPDACRFDWKGQRVKTNNTIEISAQDLFLIDHKVNRESGERINGVASGEPFWLERAREFHCYADVPGVGGGRDIPFERFDDITLHDKGGSHWFSTTGEEAQTIGIALQSVTWQVLNEDNGNFNRNSLVVYVMEKLADGSIKEHGYGFTDPAAERIGVNMKWMLVNCSMTPPSRAVPTL